MIRGERIVQTMIQKQANPYKLWQQVAVIWAATKGHLDEIEKTEVIEKLGHMLAHMETTQKELIEKIETVKKLEDDIVEGLESAIKSFFSKK